MVGANERFAQCHRQRFGRNNAYQQCPNESRALRHGNCTQITWTNTGLFDRLF
ncbi:hypothetical protein D3C74_497110 [compost metagenome]